MLYHYTKIILTLVDTSFPFYVYNGRLGFISFETVVCKHIFYLFYIWNMEHPWLIDDKKIQACFLCIKISDKVAWHFHRHSKFSNLIPCISKYKVNPHCNGYSTTTILTMHCGLFKIVL